VARAKRKGEPFFPLLLQGDPWLSVEAAQYVDVSDGSLPTEKFYKRLSNQSSRRKTRIALSFQSMNAVSMETSGIEMEIKKKETQRFLYLKRLYELSSGNTLSYFQFTEIGKELGWKDEITDEITDYLKNEGLIDFPSFGTVSITHPGIKLVEDTLKKSDIRAEPLVESLNTIPNKSTNETHPLSSPVSEDFPRPKIPIEVDPQEVGRFFTYIEGTLDQRFKTLENAGVTVHKVVNPGDKYSYQVRYKNNLVYHFSMRRDDIDNFRIAFLDGWTEPIHENASTAFGKIYATLDGPVPRIQINNLSLLGVVVRSADLSYQELLEGIWSKVCNVLEQRRKQLR